MINERMMQTDDDRTPFHWALRARIKRDGFALVKLRNNTVIDVIYQEQTDMFDEGIRTIKPIRYWYHTGKSVTSYEYDIMELLDIP